MTNPDRLAVAAHLHILLRRRMNRMTDVEWMARDDTYARAMAELALSDQTQPDLVALGQRLQALLPPATPVLGKVRPPVPAADAAPRYVRSLR